MRGIKSCLVGYKFFLVIVTTLTLQIVARHCRCCVHTTFYIFLFYVHTIFFLFFILSSDFILRSHNFSSRLHFIFSLGCISFYIHTTFPLSGYYAVISISCVHPIFHIFLFWFHTAFLIFYSFFCISLCVDTTFPLSDFFILISHCFSYFLFFLLYFIMRSHNLSSLRASVRWFLFHLGSHFILRVKMFYHACNDARNTKEKKKSPPFSIKYSPWTFFEQV